MNASIQMEQETPYGVWISSEGSPSFRHQWACVRLLPEDEFIDLLCHRMGKDEAEVRQVLESYDRASSHA